MGCRQDCWFGGGGRFWFLTKIILNYYLGWGVTASRRTAFDSSSNLLRKAAVQRQKTEAEVNGLPGDQGWETVRAAES